MQRFLNSALSGHVVRDHVIIGGLIALSTIYWATWPIALTLWLANIFLDIDHYFEFVWHSGGKLWSVSDMLAFDSGVFERALKQDFLAMQVFHTIEFWAILAYLNHIYPHWLLAGIFAGTVLHMIIDYIHLSRFKILNKRANSLIEYWWRHRANPALGTAYIESMEDVLNSRHGKP